MTSQFEYIIRADSLEKKELLKKQWEEANKSGTIHCGCGQLRSLVVAYRCLYCGIWMCVGCAEIHFSMTVQEWAEKKQEEVLHQAELKSMRNNTCL